MKSKDFVLKYKMENKKTIKIAIGIMLLGIFMISFASADNWVCFNKGNSVNFCNPDVPDRTCKNTVCKICMSNYNETRDCYNQGSIGQCNNAGDCSNFGGNTTLDITPPEFNILNPLNESLSKSRKVLLEFSLDETADVYYLDLINGRGRWVRVCYNCQAGNPSYSVLRTFNEGENNLLFKAIDVVDNEAYQNVNFFIDSIPPRIYRTEPRRGFASGDFEVQFKEDNPERVTLYYGEDEKNLNIENDCYLDRGKTYCDVSVNLEKYNGQEIEYYFEVEDIAENVYESRVVKLSVDTEYPVVNNPNSFYEIKGRYVYFNIDITEDNFEKVTYIDNNDPRARERTLCSRLYNGVCIKKQSFMKGDYSLSIQVIDEVGHSIALPAEFEIDY